MGRHYTKDEGGKHCGHGRNRLVQCQQSPGEMASIWGFHSVRGPVWLSFCANLGFLLACGKWVCIKGVLCLFPTMKFPCLRLDETVE